MNTNRMDDQHLDTHVKAISHQRNAFGSRVDQTNNVAYLDTLRGIINTSQINDQIGYQCLAKEKVTMHWKEQDM